MPVFEFVEIPLRNDLDRRRQRVAVRVRAEEGGGSVFLGDVWCGTANGRWYFTTGASNLTRMGQKHGYESREDAAEAMLDAHMATAMAQLQDTLTSVNALRTVTDERALQIVGLPDQRR
jgi:hypothetical protein